MFYEQFVIDFGSRFYRLNLKNNFTDIIFICVGSNKITGDSLGPIVGAKLKQKLGTNIAIIGTTETPVNYENIKEINDNIKIKYLNPCVICVDSAMGKNADIGKIIVNWGGITLGKAVNNGIYLESHINIKGVVGKEEEEILTNFRELTLVNKNVIEKMSNEVTEGINKVINSIV